MKEKYELAYEDYLSGMKYKDIAAKYDVTINTVKSWKSRYWKDKKGCTQKKKVAHKKVATKIQVAEKVAPLKFKGCIYKMTITQKNTCYVLAYIGRASAVLLYFNGIPFVVLLQDTYLQALMYQGF